ncbi:thiamine pyrophosphate-dependent dehydrogenase E1 component subunit alpha [Xinfangfangia sp. CPCC 101601]|uniref:Thiamine pyrophosphate-dependent dehydrogenase E1 component subunit alpha n=1 Tax=Pseudogemmobacter lacusdianii TaxID=3069608 RepID=A0ABU0W2H9_9RHOB|nr:thiamine pyrophosphate-dependent dehydrogenase E1 component subunit alpha [Xinfangfangia sp. CPCC 101601]MDQ2068108.1 thiamine pyrophosphate-dependent dehydrogenase E1 component subunit alpha [Xinfangfangia sp. CPCC 101601]
MKNAPSIDDQVEMYRKMIACRRVEEAFGTLSKEGRTRGPIHRCDGQEAVGIGATAMLTDEDYITSTHRGHAHYIGKGVDIYGISAEILGRKTGLCGGRAGHMLIADPAKGMIGGNAIVGAGIPAATGMALSNQILKNGRVAMTLFGDGSSQTGIWHESMNMAALWKLPVVFVLEHNEYGLTVHSDRQGSTKDISERAASYGIPTEIVDGNDALAVYRAVSTMVERARRGEGPGFVECKTYRWEGFSTSDMGGYQDPEVIAEWKKRDPIKIAYDQLVGEVGAEKLDQIERDTSADVRDAIERALADPLPEFEICNYTAPYSGEVH